MLGRGVAAILDRSNVGAHRGVNRSGVGKKVFHKARLFLRSYPEDVIQHQYLAVAIGAGADADGRYIQRLCN